MDTSYTHTHSIPFKIIPKGPAKIENEIGVSKEGEEPRSRFDRGN